MVLIPLWLLHRNPRMWASPDVFDPGRFLRDGEPDRFAYLPFGARPHACISAQLAMAEVTLVLARLLRRSNIVVRGTRPVLPVGVISTRPDHSPLFELLPRAGQHGDTCPEC